MPANTHMYMTYIRIWYIYIYSHIYTVLYTYIWLDIHNLTSNQCTCTHWLYIPAWLLCLLRAVFWPGTSGSYVLSILGTSSVCDSDYIWLALWLATCCWWTKSGEQFGRFSHQKFHSINSLITNIYIYIHILNRLSPSWTPTKVSWEDVPLHHRGGAGSVPHLCHRHVDRNGNWMCGRFRFPAARFWAKSFPKKRINWFGFKSFGIIFLVIHFSDLQLKGQKTVNPQRKIVVMEYHRIHFNFFLRCLSGEYICATFCYVILFDKCSLCNGYARPQVGRSFTVTRHVWGKDLLVNFTLCRSVLSNRGDLLGIFEGFLKEA